MEEVFMKRILLLTVCALAMALCATPAFAADCAAEIAALTATVAGVTDASLAYELNYMLAQATNLCGQGDEAGAMSIVSQVKGLLGN